MKKENAGSRQNGSGKKKSSAENQRDAVLSALKADEGYGGENKSEKTADDLQIALKNGIGMKSKAAKPVRSENHKEKRSKMRQENLAVAAGVRDRDLNHGYTELSSTLRAGCLLN